MTVNTATLFDQLCDQLGITPDSRGEAWMDCPWCGHGGHHFSFSERGYKCFSGSCDQHGKNLRAISVQLALPLNQRAQRVERPQVAPRPDFWQREPERWLERYCGAFNRLERWQSYKPLDIDSIAQFRLGVGKLPMWSERTRRWYEWPHRRLIVPLFDGKRVVGFYGRAFEADDQGPKWLGASGTDKSHLFLAGELTRGCTLVIVENYVDAILARQAAPQAVYAACGGATWRDPWTAQIAAQRPAHVLVWLDHDLAGNGSRYHHAEMMAAWRQEIARRRAENPALADRPWPRPPEPRGPKIANAFLEAGIRASLYEWPRGTPHKQDLASELVAQRKAA